MPWMRLEKHMVLIGIVYCILIYTLCFFDYIYSTVCTVYIYIVVGYLCIYIQRIDRYFVFI